ncbi:hypothetical protein [Flavobacterium rhizosphaerae]|uniref:Right handed beta helix region n=1 Tax=Flavobacterium rhizosphaerae TaxID=3163298 RepID=A0ABW8YTN9_9FLAO
MRHLLLFICIGFVLSLTSCREDFEFETSQENLSFSRDTVYLDTVFSNIGSSTYTLKVYNNSNKDIKIPSIKLAQGETSKYRMMIDGDGMGSGSVAGKIFNNVELLAKDSMFIFIETTIDYSEYANNETTFLYTDKIEFDSGTNYQTVELVTLVQDAIFLYPQRNEEGLYEAISISEDDDTLIYGFNLEHDDHNDEYVWTNTKPYVVYGFAAVPPGETLTVQPGAHVHFHADSGLIVKNGGTLKIGNETDAGIEENQVIFEGDRLEPDFADIPGQWFTIWLQEGSTRHNLNNLIIKNATVGILAEGHDGTDETLKMHNVQIYNNSNVGLLARNAHITGNNVVINNAGEAGLACTLGGYYRFKQCTFANYFNSYNQVPVIANDYQYVSTDAGNQLYVSNLDLIFDNCILYGSGNYGILFEKLDDSTTINATLNHCLLKFSDFSQQFRNDPFYQFEGGGLVTYTGCLIAENSTNNNPAFFNPQNNDLTITKDESAAQGQADDAIAAQIPYDITNVLRTDDPDIGAYESREVPEE